MSDTEWVPGPHHVIVRDGLSLLLADDVPRDQVLRVWHELEELDTLDGLGGLLDILRDVTGRGLGSLPAFAMSVIDERGLHVAARGGFNVSVSDLDDSQHLVRGDEASVWVERNFDTATLAEVLLGPDDLDGTWLPVTGGVLPAAGLRQGLAERAPTPRPAPVPEVEAGPEVEIEPLADEAVDVAPVESPAHETWIETASPAEAVEDDPDAIPDAIPDAMPDAIPAPRRFASLLSPHTVMHDVEEAAVRPVDAHPDDVRPAAPAPAPTQQAPVREEPDPVLPPVDPPRVGTTPPAESVPAPGPSFISGVPSRGAYVPPTASTPTPVSAPVPATPAHDSPEHHDGHTMMEAPDSTELDAYLAEATPPVGADSVIGLLCPAGHGNPTHRTECRVCGQRLTGDSVRMSRPALGWMYTSAGESIELVQNVLAGRNPRASRIQGTVMPRLLPLPHSHVSGTHLEIRLEGWSVMVVDLQSTNGTFLQRPGQPTVRLSETAQLLHSDDVVQLGHGVDLRFEALP